jgi:outer membrane protein assembly factor BamB
VCALDAVSGKECWRFVAGGRIDSPPTIADGLAIFGSRDGYVYCLRADDGELAWRFRAAPQDQRLVAYDQVESVWPVNGNVLVVEGDAYFVAGRSGCLDGGLYVYRLKLTTGEVLAQTCVYRRDPDTGAQLPSMSGSMTVAGGLPDVLATDGENIYMRNVRFDRELEEQSPSVAHMYSPAGFLDDAWWHRTYWILGTSMQCGYGGWSQVGNRVPSGRLLVMDKANIYGWGRTSYSSSGSHIGLNTSLHLFAANRRPATVTPAPQPVKKPDAGNKKKRRGPAGPQTKVQYHWTRPAELFARAMVLADKTLFVAGPLVDSQHLAESFAGEKGVVLRAVSTVDGSTVGELDLGAIPVFDGLAAAEGSLYLATKDGKVACLKGK